MRFPWQRKKVSSAGHHARKAAEQHLVEAQEQWPEVNRVAESLRDLRRRNGFGEQLTYIFQGNGDKR